MNYDNDQATSQKGRLNPLGKEVGGGAGKLEKGCGERKAGQKKESRKAYMKAYHKIWYEKNKARLSENRTPSDPVKLRAACQRYRQRHPDRLKAKRKAHASKFNEYKRKWRAKNRVRLSEKNRANRVANREKTNQYSAEWRSANPEKCKSYQQRYQKKHPEKFVVKSAKRRALKAKSSRVDLNQILAWETAWRNKKSVRCYWCGGRFAPKRCHSDHILALASGGPHEIGNLAISCASCNTHKHTRTIGEWNGKLIQPALCL